MSKATERFWERVSWLNEHRPETFYVHMLDSVMSRAKEGDVAAIEFLEKRGLIEFPNAGSR